MAILPYVGELSPYWLGVIGSIAVELGAAFKECGDLNGRCPERYKQPFYLGVRALLALASGTIPAVAEAPNALTSFYLGASAPLFLDRLARGVKPAEALTPPSGEDVLAAKSRANSSWRAVLPYRHINPIPKHCRFLYAIFNINPAFTL